MKEGMMLNVETLHFVYIAFNMINEYRCTKPDTKCLVLQIKLLKLNDHLSY